MKCPECGKDMEEGFIFTTLGATPLIGFDKNPGSLFNSKGEKLILDTRVAPTKSELKGYRCKACKIAAFKYPIWPE